MKSIVGVYSVATGAVLCLAALASADQRGAELTDAGAPAARSASSEATAAGEEMVVRDHCIPGPVGMNRQWVLITAKRVIGPRPFKPSQSPVSDYEQLRQELVSAGERFVTLIASEISATRNGLTTEITALDCGYHFSRARVNPYGKASVARFVTGTSVISLENVEMCVSFSLPGRDLDNAVRVSAKRLELDFEACKLDAENAQIDLDP